MLVLLALPVTVRGQFYFITNNGAITITGYSGTNPVVVIPSSINGLPVTSIGDSAFYRRYTLTSVTIPNGVTNIGYDAFYVCTALTSANIPDGATSIGRFAFTACYGLTGVNIPDGVTSIGESAFLSCTSLTNVLIPNSVTNIGVYAFAVLNSVTNIAVEASNPVYSSVNGVLCDKSQATLLQFPNGLVGSYTIPSSVTSIGPGAFYGSGLTNVTIPEGVSNIVAVAFEYSASLTSVTIPKSVTSIGSMAFAYCSHLTAIFFQGNAPPNISGIFYDSPTTVYYLPETTAWGATFGGNLTALWNPTFQTTAPTFGVQNNQFGFTVTGTTNIPIVLEATPDLSSPSWTPLQNCTLTNGSLYFNDPTWTNYPSRFYRIRSP
jgi:hypothetical protein